MVILRLFSLREEYSHAFFMWYFYSFLNIIVSSFTAVLVLQSVGQVLVFISYFLLLGRSNHALSFEIPTYVPSVEALLHLPTPFLRQERAVLPTVHYFWGVDIMFHAMLSLVREEEAFVKENNVLLTRHDGRPRHLADESNQKHQRVPHSEMDEPCEREHIEKGDETQEALIATEEFEEKRSSQHPTDEKGEEGLPTVAYGGESIESTATQDSKVTYEGIWQQRIHQAMDVDDVEVLQEGVAKCPSLVLDAMTDAGSRGCRFLLQCAMRGDFEVLCPLLRSVSQHLHATGGGFMDDWTREGTVGGGVEGGEEKPREWLQELFSVRGVNGRTLCYFATHHGHLPCLQMLLSLSSLLPPSFAPTSAPASFPPSFASSPFMLPDARGRTPLMVATVQGSAQAVTLLLQALKEGGREVEVDAEDEACRTALFEACRFGHAEVRGREGGREGGRGGKEQDGGGS